METKAFHKLLRELKKLTPNQEKQVEKEIESHKSQKAIEEISEEIKQCPRCGSEELYKWGMRSGLQRYKCRSCNKTFNALTKTPLARLRYKERWLAYSEDMINGATIAASAENNNVAPSTSFRWRHRFLQSNEDIKTKALHGIVEMDETYFVKSEKGNRHLDRKAHKRGGCTGRGLSLEEYTPVLIARDRGGNITDAVLQNSQTGTIGKVMLPLMNTNDVLLCSDSKSSYISFAKAFNFTHKTIVASKKEYVKEGVYHVQNVNAYCSRLKSWMVDFHGVATKYLSNYLGWWRILDTQKDLSPNSFLKLVARHKVPS